MHFFLLFNLGFNGYFKVVLTKHILTKYFDNFSRNFSAIPYNLQIGRFMSVGLIKTEKPDMYWKNMIRLSESIRFFLKTIELVIFP